MPRTLASKSKVLLPVIAFLSVTLLASYGFAQDAAPGEAPPPKGKGVISLIIENKDFITFTILALSVFATTLIIQSALRLRASAFMPEVTTQTIRTMIEGRQFKELIDFTENDPSFVSRAINPALKRAPSFAAMKEAMETSLGEQTAEQFRKIEYLNIIGNLGPLLGLLGTVLGMITAFSDMQAAGGSANPSVLAGGISLALAHTFMGLFLAVPALAAFGVLRTIVDRLTVKGALTSEELLLMIKPEGNKTPSPVKPGTPAGPVAAPRKAPPVPQPPSPASA